MSPFKNILNINRWTDRQTAQRKICFPSVSLAEAVTDDLAYNPKEEVTAKIIPYIQVWKHITYFKIYYLSQALLWDICLIKNEKQDEIFSSNLSALFRYSRAIQTIAEVATYKIYIRSTERKKNNKVKKWTVFTLEDLVTKWAIYIYYTNEIQIESGSIRLPAQNLKCTYYSHLHSQKAEKIVNTETSHNS